MVFVDEIEIEIEVILNSLVGGCGVFRNEENEVLDLVNVEFFLVDEEYVFYRFLFLSVFFEVERLLGVGIDLFE